LSRRSLASADTKSIPDRPFFKIGEVARLCALKPFVLRYWETEFRSLKPQKTRSGQRLYRREDVQLLLRIRELLHEKRFTIEGARVRLRELGHDEAPPAPPPPPEIDTAMVKRIKQSLLELIALVEEP
jgi:DNA-binding transcriptional MerR regulator